MNRLINRNDVTVANLEKEKVLDFLSKDWERHYFLILALLTGKHLRDLILFEADQQVNGLIAIRKSGKAHLCGRIPGNLDFERFKIEKNITSLLCHSANWAPVATQIMGNPSLAIKFIERTSQVMTREPILVLLRDLTRDLSRDLGRDFATQEGITYRNLLPSDLDAVMELYDESKFGSMSQSDLELLYNQGGLGHGGFINDGGERLIGVAHMGAQRDKNAFVFGIVTHPLWRQKGIAKVLVERLNRTADQLGITCHLLVSNPIAIDCYLKAGYHITGELLELTFEE